MQDLQLPNRVTICEVAPRDGFQAITKWIPTEDKVKIIRELATTGIQSLEITSFVHPAAIPQLKDAEDVVRATIDELEGIAVRALVPNLKGAERAVGAGVKKLKTMLSATDAHSLSNANAKVEDAQNQLEPIYAYAAKNNIEVMGSISVAFGCSFEGNVPVERLLEIIERYYQAGVTEISLADSTGMAQPKQVYDTLAIVKAAYPAIDFSMHFHNTRGMALANIVSALQQGITRYDSSIAGIGGCPYLPNATGNVATEDLVHMLDEVGVKTDIHLATLIDVAREARETVGVPGDSYMLTAGPSSSLHTKPTGQNKIG